MSDKTLEGHCTPPEADEPNVLLENPVKLNAGGLNTGLGATASVEATAEAGEVVVEAKEGREKLKFEFEAPTPLATSGGDPNPGNLKIGKVVEPVVALLLGVGGGEEGD